MNSIEQLLKMDANKLELPVGEVEIKRLSDISGEPFIVKVKALDSKRFNEVQEMSIEIDGEGLKKIDFGNLQMFTVLYGVTEPSLKSKELMTHFKAPDPISLINKIFLPGEVGEIYAAINDLSTYGKINVKDIKNKLSKEGK